METHNIISNIMIASKSPTAKVGDGVTLCSYTDRDVGTIMEILDNGETLACTRDETVADKTKPLGMGHQEWIHTPQPDAPRFFVKKDRKGVWRVASKTPKGRLSVNKSCTPVVVGRKDYYHDWSF